MVESKKNILGQTEQRLSFARDVSDSLIKNKNLANTLVSLDKNDFFQTLTQETKEAIKNLIEANFEFNDNLCFIQSKIYQEIVEVFAGKLDKDDLNLYLDMVEDIWQSNFLEFELKIIHFLRDKTKEEINADPFLFYLKTIKDNINTYTSGYQEGSDLIMDLFNLAFSARGISPCIFDANPNLLPAFEEIRKGSRQSKYGLNTLLSGFDEEF